MKMTITHRIPIDDDQQVPEVTNDVMLAPPTNRKVLDLARQKSFTNLPDFTYLLESLNTPTLKVGFDFANAPSEELAYNEGLSSQYSESLSLYSESQNSNITELKSIKIEPKTEPQSDYEDDSTSQASPGGTESMGIDNDVENSRLAVVGGDFQVKSDYCREDERTVNSAEQTVHELSKKMDKCCMQLSILRDPTQWTAHEVYRWACWILHESYTGYNWELGQLEKLQVDGTTLCMLHQQDFVNRIGAELGELLFIEIDLWKNAYCIEVQSVMDAQQQQFNEQYNRGYPAIPTSTTSSQQHMYGSSFTEEQPTYVDISENRPPATCISSIPTPQFEMSAITLSELNHSTPLNLYSSSQNSSCSLQMSPASNDSSLGSMGYGGGDLSDHSNEFMEDDDSRASTPNSTVYGQIPVIPQQTSPTAVSSRPRSQPKKYGGNVGHTKHTIHLWQFLRELLLQPNHFNNCIRWVDQRKGIFKIEDSARVARLWGQRKNRPAMNYDKLSRSIRQYYKKGIIKKTEQSKRLVYQFCEAYL